MSDTFDVVIVGGGISGLAAALSASESWATAVLLEPGSFGKATEEELPVGPLAACNVVSYIVRAGSDISLMLGAAGISEERMPERARAMAP